MFNKIVIELLFREIQKVLDMRKWQKVFQTNEGLTSMNYDYQYSHSYSYSPSFSLSFLSISLSPSNSPLLFPSFTRSLFTFLNFCLYSFLSLVDQGLFDICYEVESLKSHRVFFGNHSTTLFTSWSTRKFLPVLDVQLIIYLFSQI